MTFQPAHAILCSNLVHNIPNLLHGYTFGRRTWENPGAPTGRSLLPPGFSMVQAQINSLEFMLLLSKTTSLISIKLSVNNFVLFKVK